MHAIESTAQILIVDPDVATVEPLRLGLADAGYVVRAITDKAAARSICHRAGDGSGWTGRLTRQDPESERVMSDTFELWNLPWQALQRRLAEAFGAETAVHAYAIAHAARPPWRFPAAAGP